MLHVLTAAPSASAPLAQLRFDEQAEVPLPRLGGAAGEVWQGGANVEVQTQDGIRWASDGSLLFAQLSLPGTHEDLATLARAAYTQLNRGLHARGYPHWLRTWNFMDRLNEGAGDAERYRQFCLGRFDALADEPDFENRLPAATVIGTQTPGLWISVLAGRSGGTRIENPRQTSAYRYPREYGPRSPSFSRALRYDDCLLVSGTASVVGHQTLHPHDAGAQLEEIGRNLEALQAAAGGHWRATAARLYVRHPQDAALAARAQQLLGAHTPLAVLRGDISRSDLLIEMEAVFEADRS